jgi:hypothetical protein
VQVVESTFESERFQNPPDWSIWISFSSEGGIHQLHELVSRFMKSGDQTGHQDRQMKKGTGFPSITYSLMDEF